MGTYFDNYVTISGTPDAVASAKASLNAFMDKYEGDWTEGDDSIHREFDKETKPAGKGKVALSCYMAGLNLYLEDWNPDFGPDKRGQAILDCICEHGCGRYILKMKGWKQIDAFGVEVWHSGFDLWCRAKTDMDGDGVCAAILTRLSDTDMREAFQDYPNCYPEAFSTAALLLLAIGRLAAGRKLSHDDQTIKSLHKVVATVPAYIDQLLGIGCYSYSEDDAALLPMAKAWAEEEILRTELAGPNGKARQPAIRQKRI